MTMDPMRKNIKFLVIDLSRVEAPAGGSENRDSSSSSNHLQAEISIQWNILLNSAIRRQEYGKPVMSLEQFYRIKIAMKQEK